LAHAEKDYTVKNAGRKSINNNPSILRDRIS